MKKVQEIPQLKIVISRDDENNYHMDSGLCEIVPDVLACDVLEDLILCHFESGVDVGHPDYVDGILRFARGE